MLLDYSLNTAELVIDYSEFCPNVARLLSEYCSIDDRLF